MAMYYDENEIKLSIMEPKEDERFYPSKIQKIIKELFEDRLKGVEYDPNNSNQLSERLVLELREKIKRGENFNFQLSQKEKFQHFHIIKQKVKSLDIKLEFKQFWEKLKVKVQEQPQNVCGMFKMIIIQATLIQAEFRIKIKNNYVKIQVKQQAVQQIKDTILKNQNKYYLIEIIKTLHFKKQEKIYCTGIVFGCYFE